MILFHRENVSRCAQRNCISNKDRLEDMRTRQVYDQASAINKILIVNGEMLPGRITTVLVKQNLGF